MASGRASLFRHLAPVAALSLLTFDTATAAPAPQSVKASVPLSDARALGEGSARLAAGQETGIAPSIAIFGIQPDKWPGLRDAINQSVADGYPVRAVFIGPTTAKPSLEVYAHGLQVAVDGLNPNLIPPADLKKLIRFVHRELYGANRKLYERQ